MIPRRTYFFRAARAQHGLFVQCRGFVRYRFGAAQSRALEETENAFVDDFLSLDAERTQLQAENDVAQAESQVFTSVVAVYKSLGGITQ